MSTRGWSLAKRLAPIVAIILIAAAACGASAEGKRVIGFLYDFQCSLSPFERADRSLDPEILAQCDSPVPEPPVPERVVWRSLHVAAPVAYLIDDEIKAHLPAARVAELGASDCQFHWWHPRPLVNCTLGASNVVILQSQDCPNRRPCVRDVQNTVSFGVTRLFRGSGGRRLFYFTPLRTWRRADFRISMLIDDTGEILALVCSLQLGELPQSERRVNTCVEYARTYQEMGDTYHRAPPHLRPNSFSISASFSST